MKTEVNWYEKLVQEYIKDLGLKDKLHLIQKLLKEIEKELSIDWTPKHVDPMEH